MTSPGGDEVGRVSIRVVPDTSGFRRELQRAVDQAEAGIEAEIPVHFDVDPNELRSKLAAIKARVTVPVDFDVDLARLRAQLQALDSSRISIPVDLDVGTEIERLRAQLASLRSRTVRITVATRGIAEAIAQLEYLQGLVALIDGRRINIDVDVDAAAAIAQLGALNAAMAATTASSAIMGTTSRSSFGNMASAATSVAGALLTAGAAALALSVAGAGIAAAWGAASTAIAVLPAAIALAGVPLGLMLLDFEQLGKTLSGLTPRFQEFRKQATAALAEGLAPALETFATQVLPKVQAGVTNITRTMGQLAQQAVNWLATTQGTQLLNAVLTNVDTTLKSMAVGAGDIGRAFLELAAQSSTFDVLRSAVNEFGASFRSHVVDLIQSGTLDTAMRGLRDSLVELGQGFADLVHNGIELFAAAAPGVNRFLDSLSGFFNRFNWDSLGRSVGNVFAGLAETLDGVDTDTIRDIEDAFGRLGDLFKDADFQADLQGVIDGLPGVIDQMKGFAKDFAAVAADISTAVDEFNTVDQKFRDFSEGFVQSAEDLGRDLGISGEGGAFDWLKDLEEDVEGFFANPPDSEQWGKDVREGFERGLEGIEPQFGSVGGTGGSLLDWLGFGSDDLDFDEFDVDVADDLLKPLTDAFDDLDLAEGIGTAISDAAQRVRDDVPLVLAPAFSETLAGLAPAVTAGLQTGILQPFTDGWALLGQLLTFNLSLLSTSLTNAFLQWAQIATLGMQQFTAAILDGFALTVPTVQLGMQQITTAVQTGFVLIVAAAQQGMAQVVAAVQSNWTLAVSVTTSSMASMSASVQAGMAQIRANVQAGMQQSAAAVQQGVQQMVSALQAGMSQGVSVVRNGVSQMVSILNSARGQFFSAGANMGQALADGLNSKAGAVQAAANRLAQAAAAAVRAAAAIRSPSRVFIGFGEYMGEGLAIGMRRSETEVERAARSLATTVIDSVSGVQDALAGDAWAADFNARVNAELAQHDVTSPAAAGKQVTIQTTINNPLPETGSDSVAKTHRRQAAMGILG